MTERIEALREAAEGYANFIVTIEDDDLDYIYETLYGELVERVPINAQDPAAIFAEDLEDCQEYMYKSHKVPAGTPVGVAWHKNTQARIYLFNTITFGGE